MMDGNFAIRLNNVSKEFKVKQLINGHQKKTTLRAVNNISFTIEKGEVFGIIGYNGSGKSTLLSMIANIYKPTSGSIDIDGEVASILELGMGFNLEMTGRENIYLK